MDRNLTFNYETFACDWPTMEGICCQEIKKTKIKWALDADAKQETCKVATGMVHHPEHHLGISIHCVWKNMFFSLTDRHRKKILEYFSTTGLANDDNNFISAYLNFWRLIIFFFFFFYKFFMHNIQTGMYKYFLSYFETYMTFNSIPWVFIPAMMSFSWSSSNGLSKLDNNITCLFLKPFLYLKINKI